MLSKKSQDEFNINTIPMKLFPLLLFFLLPFVGTAQQHPDVYITPMGPLVITPVNHGSVMLRIKGKVIHAT